MLEDRERVEDLGGPDRDALLAQVLGKREQRSREPALAPLGDAVLGGLRRRLASAAGSSITPTRLATVSMSVLCLRITLIVCSNVPRSMS